MQFRLRSLLILLALGPPVLAGAAYLLSQLVREGLPFGYYDVVGLIYLVVGFLASSFVVMVHVFPFLIVGAAILFVTNWLLKDIQPPSTPSK